LYQILLNPKEKRPTIVVSFNYLAFNPLIM